MRSSPATARSRVVFPEPERPKIAVTPVAGTSKHTSTSKEPRRPRSAMSSVVMDARLSRGDDVEAARRGVDGEQHGERKQEHSCTQPMRLRIAQSLDMVVDGDREHLRAPRDVTPEHEHDAKLTHRVRKPECH